jgi:hypothetical protein
MEIAMHPTARLPRAWWFPSLKGYRSGDLATYVRFPLDEQPQVSVAEDLSWLAAHSFSEFLYRFWIENELWLALAHGEPLEPRVAAYASNLARSEEP